MKTESYNPSPLEVEFATAIATLKNELENGLTSNKIVEVKSSLSLDNPQVFIKTTDLDGDSHEFVIKVIQRPDKF